jgi:hypothetical protein
LWCDDRGFVIEDGVVLRHGPDEFVLTVVEPNYGYFSDLFGRLDVSIEDITDDWAIMAVHGPRSRDLLREAGAAIEKLPYFGITMPNIDGVPVTVSRTRYTGDLAKFGWYSKALPRLCDPVRYRSGHGATWQGGPQLVRAVRPLQAARERLGHAA